MARVQSISYELFKLQNRPGVRPGPFVCYTPGGLGDWGRNTQWQRKDAMPKPSLHALTWSQEQEQYELYIHGQREQCFRRGDEPAFSRWLAEHTSFAFEGQAGRISVIKEARPGGTGYWYAYRTQDRHTRKRYLGSTTNLTFARLEEQARVLKSSPWPAPLVPEPPG